MKLTYMEAREGTQVDNLVCLEQSLSLSAKNLSIVPKGPKRVKYSRLDFLG